MRLIGFEVARWYNSGHRRGHRRGDRALFSYLHTLYSQHPSFTIVVLGKGHSMSSGSKYIRVRDDTKPSQKFTVPNVRCLQLVLLEEDLKLQRSKVQTATAVCISTTQKQW